ncbi:Cysteine desulfurase [Sulfidibacter corallicola]|uniref:cysteine desulfurase n=1 Tax=Sulfidibacter corallicola TaxID=2818388 RepID=A0A8A4TVJ7_SULCO|nr:aminotransferase class V-fold PLP-dependent enzyme [Sulfidibacter corallicola]QTD53959.1 aminotransferase class V-fold PLP-dependent enzyme [Sulfidibacter corallicola]
MSVKTPVYLDYQSTTPVDPRVVTRMLPFFTERFGNAASVEHRFGWEAEEAVAQARERLATSIGAKPEEIVFTSGATESNNLAILGVAWAYRRKGDHLITVATEHKAVLDPFEAWRREGGQVTVLPVGRDGMLDLQRLEDAVTDRTTLVSVMAANNEIGVLQDLEAIGRIAKNRGVLFHSDAAQALGKIDLDMDAMGIDLLSFSGHKIYAPKGIGGLYVRRRNPRVRLAPQIFGGGHERGLRSGTLNVPAIVALGEAVFLARTEMTEEAERLRTWRDKLWTGLQRLGGVFLNGALEPRLPGNLNVSFDGVAGEKLLLGLQDLALSSRSACTTASDTPSHVLAAIGAETEAARAALRIGLGRFTTEAECAYAESRIVEEVKKLRVRAAWHAAV